MKNDTANQLDDALTFESECKVYSRFDKETLEQRCAEQARQIKQLATSLARARSEIGQLRKLVRLHAGILNIPVPNIKDSSA